MYACLSRALSRDLAHNPGMCSDWELNWQPFGSQAGAQFTEPHQPGKEYVFLIGPYYSPIEDSTAK